ncbi:hypothetical protein DXK93_18800 [Achromobacter sp. K91]|nr:hypothetical protein DXK93_18800 [Achromobacter sp. K91]
MARERLERTKDVAQIISLICVPILVAFFGWQFQAAEKDKEVRRDYVQLAISALTSERSSSETREWAAAVLSEFSPVPLGPRQASALKKGEAASWAGGRPALPANLFAPCQPIPRVDSPSWDDLAQAHAALAFQYAECAARHQAVVDAWGKP